MATERYDSALELSGRTSVKLGAHAAPSALATPTDTFQLEVSATGITIDTGTKTAAATAGAATLSKLAGKVTSESITTAAAATYTLTVTNTLVAATSIVLVSVANGTNTQGATMVQSVTPAAGSFVVIIKNVHASQAFNGTIVVSFVVLN